MMPAPTLLSGALDYAGLFPPAALSLPEAVAEYARASTAADRWLLGRFVLPASSLGSLADLLDETSQAVDDWELSVTVPENDDASFVAIERYLDRKGPGSPRVAAIEGRAATAAAARAVVGRVPAGAELFLEVGLGEGVAGRVAAVSSAGAFVKFRTGGVTRQAIPSPEQLLDGLHAALASEVPFKCTAGLHHPIRGCYPLTYAPDSETAVMHGYLNLFLAVGFLVKGWSAERALHVLRDTEADAFTVWGERAGWRGEFLTPDEIAHVRRAALRGFGSCSIREPLSELSSLAPA